MCECIAHALQELSELDRNTTIISIDGIGAYDQISWAAMLDRLMNVARGSQALPFAHAVCECIAHALEELSELDRNTTIISIDGIGAYDQISWAAMLDRLMNVARGSQALPFVRMFYGAPSSCLWEDSPGVTHTIPQGEGGNPFREFGFFFCATTVVCKRHRLYCKG